MQLTEKQLKEFKDIYFKTYWEEISDKDALEWWTKLVNLIKTIMDSNNKKSS
jgi:hypothetical protein